MADIIKNEAKETESQISDAVDKLTCKISSLHSLDKAAAGIHSESHNEKKLCPVCGKRFEKLYHRHLKIHTEDKRYKCDKCRKSYKHKTDLVRHKFLHSGLQPYSYVISAILSLGGQARLKHTRGCIRESVPTSVLIARSASNAQQMSDGTRLCMKTRNPTAVLCVTGNSPSAGNYADTQKQCITLKKTKKPRPYNGGYKCDEDRG